MPGLDFDQKIRKDPSKDKGYFSKCGSQWLSLLREFDWRLSPVGKNLFPFSSKQRPKRRRKPSDVSGLPLSPRLGWG
jgi:hypothetical protein